MKNLWTTIKKPVSTRRSSSTRGGPFFCLAPMADVTDFAFRKILAKYGKPDVTWTEFVSADGLANKTGQKKLLINLKFSKKEKPIVAQIFGSNPENIKKAVALCKKLGFDGVDLNMGCPDKAVEKQNSGAAMMKNPRLAKEILEAARSGAGKMPISIKTRIGYSKNEIDTWIKFLLEQDLPALTIHLRTRKEMSNVPAHWEIMPKIIAMRDKISPNTLIIGNGDVESLEDAKKKAKESGCDGVMIGRGIFGKPNFFSKNKKKVPLKKKLKILIEHTELFEKEFIGRKSFAIMKKHFKAYVNGFNGAKELRAKLMETKNSKEVKKNINDFFKNN